MCKGYRKYSITKEEILIAELELYDYEESEYSYSEDETEDDSYVEESSTESESSTSASLPPPPPSPVTSDIYDAIPGVPNLCTMAHFNQYMGPPRYFRIRSRLQQDYIFHEAHYSEEETRNSWFLPFGNDYVMHPKYFPPSMLESESISFDQGRPVYAPGVKEPEIPAVMNGIDFKEDIEQNSNSVKKIETGEMQQSNDMKMCISFDNSVTKNLCRISEKYSRPMVDSGKEEVTFNPGSYHCVKQLHNIALNELDQRHRGTFPIKDTLIDFDMVNQRMYECPKLLHLHPLYILRQRPRLKCISLHNLDSYILDFYPNLTAPKLCVDSIKRLAKITTWLAFHAYTKTINMVDGITVPIYANRKQAMALYFPRPPSQKMTKVKMLYNGKEQEIFKNVYKPPVFDNNRQVIKANTRYVDVTCRQSLYKKHFENFHKELRNKSKDNQ